MTKSYLVLEKGLLERERFPVRNRVTIGRSNESDITLSDPAVSRRHAVVYRLGEDFVVEDEGSSNGTYVNGERIRKAILAPGDILRVGSTELRFFRDEEEAPASDLISTRHGVEPEEIEPTSVGEALGRSRRLHEALSKVPLFSRLDHEGLKRVSQAARLRVFDKDEIIIREGDQGRSLFIILQGKVRVFTRSPKGRILSLSILSEDQFFGELSFLTGEPRRATVQALEESFLCELSFKSMRELLHRSPEIREELERYCHERLKDREGKLRKAGFMERRKGPRFNVEVPVRFTLSARARVSGQFKGREFSATSKDISLVGIRLAADNPSISALPPGTEMQLNIELPEPWGMIRTTAILKNLIKTGKEGQPPDLGVEFEHMTPADRERLKHFLYG